MIVIKAKKPTGCRSKKNFPYLYVLNDYNIIIVIYRSIALIPLTPMLQWPVAVCMRGNLGDSGECIGTSEGHLRRTLIEPSECNKYSFPSLEQYSMSLTGCVKRADPNLLIGMFIEEPIS